MGCSSILLGRSSVHHFGEVFPRFKIWILLFHRRWFKFMHGKQRAGIAVVWLALLEVVHGVGYVLVNGIADDLYKEH
jgi:hypothetical protein